jgi:predicted Zn-dependent peptidase
VTRSLPSGVRRTVLKGGLRVVTEQMPGVRSAAVGVFVQVGSRDEAAQLNGASHFLEHLLFKGTPTRSAMDISTALDEVGGEFNAYTAREYTCYHARVLDEDLPMALDVLGDMLTASLLTPEDVEAEREVILDEIAMHDDDPDDVVHNLFASTAWAGTPLARPIAGTAESIKELTRTQIRGYYQRRYRPEVTTLAVAGNIDHDDVVRRARRAFSRNGFLDGDARPAGPRVAARPRPFRFGEVSASRPFEQVNVVLGMQGLTRSDPRRYPLSILQAALGGSSSSRLFQEVRERRGLAYSVYSFGLGYSDAGMVGVAAGSLPGKATDLLRVVRSELARVAADGLTEEEVERGRGQARGGLVLSLEDSGSRMTRLGEAALFQHRLLSVDEVLERVEAVSVPAVHDLARELYTRPQTLAQVGPA